MPSPRQPSLAVGGLRVGNPDLFTPAWLTREGPMPPSLFDFETPINRRNTASLKWERYADPGVIPLWVADMDFPSPPAVIDALRRRIDHGVFGYTEPPATLADAVIDRLAQRYRWPVDPEWIVWLPGLVTALNVCCLAVGNDGDEVLTTVPVYPPFLSAPGNTRRRLRTVPLKSAADCWAPDFEAIRNATGPATRLFILCNPHNPTGRVYTRRELEQLAEISLENDLIICSDEIHCELILDADRTHLPFATLAPEIASRTITLMAPSKTYNVPGLGCAFAIISDPGLRRRFHRAMAGIVPGVNLFGYVGAEAAYRHGNDWLTALIEVLRRNRETVVSAVDRMPSLSTRRPQATYLAWIDARNTGLENPAAFFEAAGVGLNDGADFGTAGFVRLNFGCPPSVLQLALERMDRALRPATGEAT